MKPPPPPEPPREPVPNHSPSLLTLACAALVTLCLAGLLALVFS